MAGSRRTILCELIFQRLKGKNLLTQLVNSDEHYRRSPQCPFFVFAGTSAPKRAKSKKGRPSKASRVSKGSRMSTQSRLSVASQVPSIPDLDESIDTSSVSVISTLSTTSKAKGTRGRKKNTKATQPELPMVASEPDLPVVEIARQVPEPARPKRGKKRTSDEISGEDEERAQRSSTVVPEPATKKPRTRKAVKTAKTTKTKGKPKDKTPQLSIPGAFSPLILDQSIEPSFAATIDEHMADAAPEEEMLVLPPAEKEVSPTPTERRSQNDTKSPPGPLQSSTRRTLTPRKADMATQGNRAPSISPPHGSPSSDIENIPPNSQLQFRNAAPAEVHIQSPVKNMILLSPSKLGGVSGVTSENPWTPADVELVFSSIMTGVSEEHRGNLGFWTTPGLTSPEKKMTVEEWIYANAARAEAEFRAEAERFVTTFEREGQRALGALEGLVCQ